MSISQQVDDARPEVPETPETPDVDARPHVPEIEASPPPEPSPIRPPAAAVRPRAHPAAATVTPTHGAGRRTDGVVAALVLGDLAAAALAGVAARIAHAARVELTSSGSAAPARPTEVVLTVLPVVLPAVWVAALAAHRAYDRSLLTRGAVLRVVRALAGLVLFALVVCALLAVPVNRGWLVAMLPALLALTLVNRLVLVPSWLTWRRSRGDARASRPVLLVGPLECVAALARRLPPTGADRAVGAYVCGDDGRGDHVTAELQTYGLRDFTGCPTLDVAVELSGAATVAVVGVVADEDVRRIVWQLEGTGVELTLVSALPAVARERLDIAVVSGVPALRVAGPRLRGPRHVVKAAVDRASAALLLTALAPVLACLALAVKLTSTGPVLFRQTRVGRDGVEFRMLKFRSMHPGSEHRVLELVHRNDSDGILFKLRDDPRVTPLGAVLRRYSLDELPQLVNVLCGSMSLVGPRPALPTEVARYGVDARRRLMVKPGLTGLWQVSGRSDLPWDEAVRLDLRYVDEWSLSLDVQLLARTVRAVLRGAGAY